MVASGVGWADGLIREHSEDQTLELVKLLLDLVPIVKRRQRPRDHPAARRSFQRREQSGAASGESRAKLDAQITARILDSGRAPQK